MKATATAPAYDPLLAATPLPYQAEFYPFGFPVSVASNARQVLEAARQSWARMPARFDAKPIDIRCLVSEKCAADGVPPDPVVRARSHLLVSVADASNFACCDLAGGIATAWVTGNVAADFSYFRYHFLEAMAYCLLDTLHLVAVHAACVSLDGHGVLLAGESGAGKSSLAYACARRGWVFTSDDSSSLLRQGSGRTVLGNCRAFRFRSNTGDLFPEFRGLSDVRRPHGKPTIEVATASLPGIDVQQEADISHIVFLRRWQQPSVELVPISDNDAWTRLFFDPWPAELPSRDSRHAAVRRLLKAPSYELRYRDLDHAVDRLEKLVRGGLQ